MDSLQNVSKKERTVTVVPQYAGVIYLTFDDGPWTNTGALLDALKKYNVKATFFVTRKGDDAMIKREYDEGHTVALHTGSHDYSYVYASVENYFADLAKIQERVKRITGQTTTLIRFPGGSSNTVSRKYDGGTRIMTKLVQEVTSRGYTYFDWNISSGDAGSTTDPYVVYTNVIDNLYVGGEFVVLQHDTKNYSIEAIESIIQFGLKNGFKFERLTADSPTAHHHVNN
jgi:peptidoglycan/xylan/chitin deacetylase (PgdA/CDA1 family)